MTTEGDAGLTSDRSLLAAHVEGDADAFATLVRRHRDRMWSVAFRTLGDREEAADALQEAFISALRGASRFRGDAEVSTWLHRIVVNACLDRLRRRKARPTVPLDGHEVRSRYDEHAATLTRLDLRAALDKLPDAQRMALVLVDIEDVPVAEAAQILGVAEGTIKSRCARGRTALAAAMQPGYRPSPSYAGTDHAGTDHAGTDYAGTDQVGTDLGTDQLGTDHLGTDHTGTGPARSAEGKDTEGKDTAGRNTAGRNTGAGGNPRAGSGVTAAQEPPDERSWR